MSSHPPATASESAATSDPAAQSGAYRWWLVGMLWFICFFNYADRQAISSVLPLLGDEFGFDKEQQGRIVSAFMIVYALTAPMAGSVGDRFSRKAVILGGLYVWSLVTGMTAFCSKLWQFIFVRGAEGLGETFYFPASMSLVSAYHGQDTRSRAMGLHQTSVYAGIIGGGVFTGYLAEHYGWRFPFILFGGAGIVLGLVLARFVREPSRTAPPVAGDAASPAASEPPVPWLVFARDYLFSPASCCLLLAFIGANTVAGVFYYWMTTFMKEKFEFNLATASLFGTATIQIPSMIGSLAGGAIADAWRQRWLGGRVGVQALGILVGTPLILVCALAEWFPLVVLGMAGLGFCKGIYDSNIWASMYEVVPASRRGSAVGMANMLSWGGAGLGTWALGYAVTHAGVSMSQAIASTAVIYAVAAALLWASALVFTPRKIRALGNDLDQP